MAEDKEDQLEIQLEEAPKATEPEIEVVKAEEAPQRREIPTEVGIRELKFQLEQEKLARAQAEQNARMAAQREFAAKSEVTDTNLSLINNAISTTQQETAYLKSGYRRSEDPRLNSSHT